MHVPTLLALLLSLAAPGSATEAVRARDAEIRAALPPPGTEPTPAARAKLEAVLTRTLDLPAMVERAMGQHWAKATASQRRRILGAFEKRFRAITGSQLDAYRSTELTYGAETPAPGGAVNVPTSVIVKGEPTELAYTVRRGKDGWRIEDVIIDGASTVEGFRSSFAKTIAKEGISGLVTKLEKAAAGKQAQPAGRKVPAGASAP